MEHEQSETNGPLRLLIHVIYHLEQRFGWTVWVRFVLLIQAVGLLVAILIFSFIPNEKHSVLASNTDKRAPFSNCWTVEGYKDNSTVPNTTFEVCAE